ncbi:MAG TPA: low temperature requirement protein A [Gemmatimonadaceae bacterium]
MSRSIVSPDDQKVTFVELFFDLVFVFSVTQVVGLLHDGVTWRAVGEAVLVFWLVWWGWTQFTWALNAADTTHPRVEVATLIATGVAFFLAVGVPSAFHGYSRWFAGTYVAVRVLGLLVYDWVAWVDPTQRAAVRLFSAVSLSGLVAVLIGGFAGGAAQYAWWGLAIVLDVVAAGIGGRAEGWNLHPEHFAERHGLFVIIALGESLIVAATGLTEGPWPGTVIAAAILAVAVTGTFWWSYFTRAKVDLDHALESVDGVDRSRLARDAFSIVHFPVLCGVVAYAASVEEILAHPVDVLPVAGRVLLGSAVLLFVGGLAAALWRAGIRVAAVRRWVPVLTAIGVVAIPAPGLASLAIVLGGMLLLAFGEGGGAPDTHLGTQEA